MSLLPERKKSVDEIAKLREAIGVPGQDFETPEIGVEKARVPSTASSSGAITIAKEAKTILDPNPKNAETAASLVLEVPVMKAAAGKISHSLKRSERIPILPLATNSATPLAQLQAPASQMDLVSVPQEAKPVRSLRKSEQVIHPHEERPQPPVDSPLPVHRHSDQQISEIKRQEMLAMAGSAAPVRSQKASTILVIIGYLLVIVGAVCVFFYSLPLIYPTACLALSALIAAGVFALKPLSRHHASFMGVMILLTAVFGALHYFPHLQYGT